MTIIAACVITLKKSPAYRLAKEGTMPVWSGFGMSGTDAVGITAFRSVAEELDALHLGEGDAITVTGTLSLNTWEGKDGVEHSGLKIVASKAEVITPPTPKRRASSPRRSDEPAPPTPPASAYDDFDDPLPEHWGQP
ncbi:MULTISPECIES: single-stranded DNA-binding protein [Acidithiobacillus]|uniref:Single-stranded DNA-binding protein n=2 Tax=Acidithiobacillus TaxID=119977 RepID=A0A179B6S8_ACIFR|nr:MULTISPECIES: single-stranded DNA-binding protein [Acidithiobacillus]MEB8487286.1 single-stranded DNA-binding protein [Acidithiobacillus ferriphilus]MEB8490408.1 single-stranded DNA-binding protein [Acidithiobacillus ferriphilus]MEB8494684.1 single-stranded DNA-binding protein [Acidithiobacillus ferriphilus]MEB8515262.1 single-stranded DNA-binding protein [Acidithiobacillus ferriphilus]MEB8519974.1 single-stranded DNA-binding protein [Acidithiobacillus ferriphilus]